MNDLYEMGWNDVVGNLAHAEATEKAKREFATRLAAGAVTIPRPEPEYAIGVKDAATAFLNGEPITYKGPDWVRERLQA